MKFYGTERQLKKIEMFGYSVNVLNDLELAKETTGITEETIKEDYEYFKRLVEETERLMSYDTDYRET